MRTTTAIGASACRRFVFARSGQAAEHRFDVQRRGPTASVPVERHPDHRRPRRHPFGAGHGPFCRQRAARSEGSFHLVGAAGQRIPLSQIGTVDPHGRPDPASPRSHADDHRARRHCRGLAAAGRVHRRVEELQPIIAKLPAGYRIEQGGSIEESGKANRAWPRCSRS